MKKYLLFDLDGTLTDPKVGICTCVQYALSSFGIEEPDLDKLEPFIGPPLKESFMNFYGFDEEKAEAAIAKYRERFSTVGLFENEIYEGIPRMLKALSAQGMFLAVASSKPTVYVERILEHFKIRKYFKAVVGSELDGTRVNKDEVVEEALRRLFGDQPVNKAEVYMIGDRKFDVEGAKIQGVESVGVTYGYGGMEELREAKADYIVRSVEELQSFLLRGTQDPKPGLNFQKIWQFGFPFLLFLFVKSLAINLVAYLYQMIGGEFAGIALLLYDEEGAVVGLTGNASAFMQIVGYLAGTLVIFKTAKEMIARADEENKLLYIKGMPLKNYGFMIMATLGLMFGLNMLLELTGLTANSQTYREVAKDQYSANLYLGLVLFVLAAPLAEEFLFRGIIYNCLRRYMKPLPAVVIAAAFFGVYHGNSVQGIYGFIMGCLIIYAYLYFGDFRMTIAVHALVNLVTYVLGHTDIAVSGIVSWPVCLFCLAIGGVGVYLLAEQKKVLC